MSQIFVLFGPTASGKTQRAVELAQQHQASLLSFDSRHVYQGMNIVTGKDFPTKIPSNRLFGFDLVRPDQEWSVFHFYRYAQPILEQHRAENRSIVLFGGSWPYVQTLINPPESLGVETSPQLRLELDQLPLAELQDRLIALGKNRWRTMNESDRSNSRRLVRAIEVATLGGGFSLPPLLTEFELTLLEPKLDSLERKIAQRVQERWENGAISETQLLIQQYPSWNFPAFSSTGYTFIRQHIEGVLTEVEARRLWTTEERQYAKRQMTWVRKIATQT